MGDFAGVPFRGNVKAAVAGAVFCHVGGAVDAGADDVLVVIAVAPAAWPRATVIMTRTSSAPASTAPPT